MKAYVILFIGVVSVSFAAIFIRLAEAPALVIASYRLTIASLILAPIALTKAISQRPRLRLRNSLLILLSSLFLALHFGLWIASLDYTSIASSVVLVTAHPALVAVASYFLWGERLSRLKVAGIALAFAGVAWINYGGFNFSLRAATGNLLALVAGFAMAGYLLIGSHLRERISMMSYLAIIYAVSAVMLLVATAICRQSLFGYSGHTYLMLVLLAIIPQLLGHSSLNLAVRLIPVTLVSVAILGEPVGATVLAGLILGEMPSSNEIGGGLLILSGILMVVRPKREKSRSGNL